MSARAERKWISAAKTNVELELQSQLEIERTQTTTKKQKLTEISRGQ